MTRPLGIALLSLYLGMLVGVGEASTAAIARLPSGFCSGREDGRYAHPRSLIKFVLCVDGALLAVGKCPRCWGAENRYWVFDEHSQRCNRPAGAECPAQPPDANQQPAAQALLVWAGPQNSSQCADALFVLNATAGAGFGRRVARADSAYSGTEPHHGALSADGKIFAAGGLLAVLKGAPDLVFFDVSNIAQPKFQSSADPPQSSIPDDFIPLPHGSFLVTMMGSASGGAPGRVAKIRPNLTVEAEYPDTPPLDPPFNPHGLAVDLARQRMVSADYLLPASTLIPTSGVVLRTTFRVWDMTKMSIISTYDAGAQHAAGFMDAKMLGDTGIAVLGSGKGRVYAVDVEQPDRVQVVWFTAKNSNHCLFAPLGGGTRLLLTTFGASLVQLLDTSDPWKFKLIQEVYLPAGGGAHFITVSPDERTAAVSTYFLDEDPSVGVVHVPGSRRVHFLSIGAGGNSITHHATTRSVGFSRVLKAKCGGYRPHGMAFKGL